MQFQNLSEDLKKIQEENTNSTEEIEKHKIENERLLKDNEDLKFKFKSFDEDKLTKEDEIKKLEEQTNFFKEILEKEVKEKEELVKKSSPEDLERIEHLERENETLGKKVDNYENKINKLDQDNEFLQKLIKNKEEVINLKTRYTYVSNLLTSVKNPGNLDPQLINYAESVLSDGQSMFGKDEVNSLIPDEDLLSLTRRMTNYQGEVDTYNLSKTQSKLILYSRYEVKCYFR